MYGILTYIYLKNQRNVGKYTKHGSYGIESKRIFSWLIWVSQQQGTYKTSLSKFGRTFQMENFWT